MHACLLDNRGVHVRDATWTINYSPFSTPTPTPTPTPPTTTTTGHRGASLLAAWEWGANHGPRLAANGDELQQVISTNRIEVDRGQGNATGDQGTDKGVFAGGYRFVFLEHERG